MIGTHLIVDCYGVMPQLLCDASTWEALLHDCARSCALTPVSPVQMHIFEGGGLTGFVMLSQSHIAFHTYPEHSYAALDIFSCGDGDLELALNQCRKYLQPLRLRCREVVRGTELFEEIENLSE